MSGHEDNNAVCRDFQRGVCNRGTKCKYYHPSDSVVDSEEKLPICKDFQNKGCNRSKCKFLHITQKEEEHYNITGILPEHKGDPSQVVGPKSAPSSGILGSNEICKDFLNNICNRGNRCKFKHVTEEQKSKIDIGYGKRRRDGFDMMGYNEENELLRRKVADLQRQVLDLRQMNDTLYEQNMRYRNQLRSMQSGGSGSQTDYHSASVASMPAPLTDSSLIAYDGYSKF